VKRYGKYRRKVSWIAKIYGNYSWVNKSSTVNKPCDTKTSQHPKNVRKVEYCTCMRPCIVFFFLMLVLYAFVSLFVVLFTSHTCTVFYLSHIFRMLACFSVTWLIDSWRLVDPWNIVIMSYRRKVSWILNMLKLYRNN
jgi:hypothetical protein